MRVVSLLLTVRCAARHRCDSTELLIGREWPAELPGVCHPDLQLGTGHPHYQGNEGLQLVQ